MSPTGPRCVLALLFASSLAFAQSAPSGDVFMIGAHPHELVVIDSARDEVAAQIPTRGRAPKEVVPAPDGTHVFVTSEVRQQIEVINWKTQKVEDVIDLAPPGIRINIFGMAVSRKGDRLFLHVKQMKLLPDEYKILPPEIWSLDLRTHQKQKILTAPEGVVSLLVPDDENQLIAWGRDLYYIDLAQKRITHTLPLMTRGTPSDGPLNTLPFFLQFEQSGILSMPYYTNDPITKKDVMGLANFDVNTGKLDLVELGAPIPLYSCVVTPDRKRAYCVMNQIVEVDLEKRQIVSVQDLKRTTYVINISRDGRKLYLPSAGSFLSIYDAGSLKLLKQIQMPGDPGVSQLRAVAGGS